MNLYSADKHVSRPMVRRQGCTDEERQQKDQAEVIYAAEIDIENDNYLVKEVSESE